MKRAIIVVIDGLGIGELPDAPEYGDAGSHTLDNTARAVGGVKLETLASLGLGNIEGVESIEKADFPEGAYGRMLETSVGKDTTTGHWEIAGVVTKTPFATFPDGFPDDIKARFAAETGSDYLWGRPASGTEIIKRFGEEHLSTGRLIVYGSADSVFQIAAHEDVMPLEKLYGLCAVMRELLDGYNICRVVARPFTGPPGSFRRTEERKDFSVPPPGETLLDRLRERGVPVVGIGKLGDIFAHRGFSEELRAGNDTEVLEATLSAMERYDEGLIFSNMVDCDTLYGHRNDPSGYARSLEAVDRRLKEIKERLGPGDVFVVTADHGCDPTTPSTDHSREYVPLLICGEGVKKGAALGTRRSFSDLGRTLGEVFGVGAAGEGEPFLGELTGERAG